MDDALARLTRALHAAARDWAEVENGSGAAAEITPIARASYAPGGATRGDGLATSFRVRLPSPMLGGHAEYVVHVVQV